MNRTEHVGWLEEVEEKRGAGELMLMLPHVLYAVVRCCGTFSNHTEWGWVLRSTTPDGILGSQRHVAQNGDLFAERVQDKIHDQIMRTEKERE